MSLESNITYGPVWPQSRERRSPYRRRLLSGRMRVKYDILAALWFLAVGYFWVWWLDPIHIVSGPIYWMATFALFWLSFLHVYFVVIFRRAEVPAAQAPAPGTVRVAMITTKTPSEPFPVLKRTLEAMLTQSYPHDTWLADEDPSQETIAWCEAHSVRISTRKNRPDYHRSEWPRRTRCKEGNLAFFYDHYGYDSYDFVSQFDADHVPTPSYLEEVMRGFADPEVGFVSAPSICSNNIKESWAARTRLYSESTFHGILQCGCAALMSPMCIGSHYTVRTRALREVGGIGPDLAEDHSTTLLMNAGGWRGMHAIDAIATGDGPATFADLCVQEFQWARSLVTILLRYTPSYLKHLPIRTKLQFVFSQMSYPMNAITFLLLYLIPIATLFGDFRIANVTFIGFFSHALPAEIILITIALSLRADGFFRPFDGKILSWEKALFFCIQWPWGGLGCIMAIRDHLTGKFVEFRVTPKGEAAVARLPRSIFLPFLILGLGSVLPVLLIDNLVIANGFYLLTLLNAFFFVALSLVVVIRHIRDNDIVLGFRPQTLHFQLLAALTLAGFFVLALNERGKISLYALTIGMEPVQLVRLQYYPSGAGLGPLGTLRFTFDPAWVQPE